MAAPAVSDDGGGAAADPMVVSAEGTAVEERTDGALHLDLDRRVREGLKPEGRRPDGRDGESLLELRGNVCPRLDLDVPLRGGGMELDAFEFFFRHRHVEFLFERHDEFNRIERVSAQIVDKRGGRHDFFFFDPKLLNDDFLNAFFNAAHDYSLLLRF
mgnify:CR=1 FL=1